MDTTQLKRIADALEEILQLVKEDQEKMRKINEEKTELTHSNLKEKYASLEPNNADQYDGEITDRSVNPLIRIADALEEILRLVKADQEKMEKYKNENN